MSKQFATNPGGAKKGSKKKGAAPENPVDTAAAAAVTSDANNDPAHGNLAGATQDAPAGLPGKQQEGQMAAQTVTLKRRTKARKNDKLVIFEMAGRPELSVQFHRSAFPETIPDEIQISGDLAEARTPKAKETPEERKARLKALPKPTLEEKAKKAEERAAKLKAKLEAQQAKAKAAAEGANAPSGDQPAQ